MNRPEESFQKSVIQYLTRVAPDVFVFHVPNQMGTRKAWEQGLLTGLGMKSGVADLVLVWAPGRVGFIELKTLKGNLSSAQITFRHHMTERGAPYALCRSLDDVEAALKAWGAPMRGGLS